MGQRTLNGGRRMHPNYQVPAKIERKYIRLDSGPMVKYKSVYKHLQLQEDSPVIQGLKTKARPKEKV